MTRLRNVYLAALAVLLSPLAVQAVPIVWTLDDVVFDDGTSATGSYTYDADTNAWSDWAITVVDGTLSAFTYDSSNSQNNSANQSSLGFLFVDNGFSRYINFNFVGNMTNAGGSLALELATGFTDFQTGSWECDNCSTFRWITGGSVSTVPEPATLALFGLGLAGIGFSRRKKA